jgi:hypothetical protein
MCTRYKYATTAYLVHTGRGGRRQSNRKEKTFTRKLKPSSNYCITGKISCAPGDEHLSIREDLNLSIDLSLIIIEINILQGYNV